MCKYCESGDTLFNEEFLDSWTLSWGNNITKDNAMYTDYHLLIDRGYIRFIDILDGDCLDHGLKIKIKFCPMCGEEL